jgi:photosystem II stability/assembly factor-like uncharacterized protein
MAIATGVLELLLLTGKGVVKGRLPRGASRVEVAGMDIDDENIRSVWPDPFNPRHVYACSTTDMYSSDDAGDSWTRLSTGGIDFRDIWTMSVHPTRRNVVYVGTMPANLYVSENGGRSFTELSGFRQLPDYAKWGFPSPPHNPTVRWICLDERAPDEIIVGVEEGGVARSRDAGATWAHIDGPASDEVYPKTKDPAGILPSEPGHPVPQRVYRDVHRVMRDPRSLDRIYAATGYGLYLTDNGGLTWERVDYGMERGYAVVMAMHTSVPERLFVGTAEYGPPAWFGYRFARTGPFNSGRWNRNLTQETGGAHAAIQRTTDSCRSWTRLTNGLPDGNPYMVSGIDVNPTDPDEVFISYTDGTLYRSTDAGDSWAQVLDGVERLYGVRVLKSDV